MKKTILAAFAVSMLAASPSMAMDDMNKPMHGMMMHHPHHCMMVKKHEMRHGHMMVTMEKVCR